MKTLAPLLVERNPSTSATKLLAGNRIGVNTVLKFQTVKSLLELAFSARIADHAPTVSEHELRRSNLANKRANDAEREVKRLNQIMELNGSLPDKGRYLPQWLELELRSLADAHGNVNLDAVMPALLLALKAKSFHEQLDRARGPVITFTFR